MPRKHHRYKLLFDEGLPLPKYFPRLNNRFDVKHIVEDFQLAGATDVEVYQRAVKEKRLIVTFNKKHFQKLAENGVTVIFFRKIPLWKFFTNTERRQLSVLACHKSLGILP